MASFEKIEWCDKKHRDAFSTILPDNNDFIDNIKEAIKSNLFELWEIEGKAFMTTKVDTLMTGERVLQVLDICGHFTGYFYELSVFVEALAKTYKCDKIIINTHRKALVKKYSEHGFKITDYTLERAVNEQQK